MWVGFQQKMVLFGDFKILKLENLPKTPIICPNPSTLENYVPKPNRVTHQLVTYFKSNVFYSLSFFILCTFDLHLSHLADFLNILIIILEISRLKVGLKKGKVQFLKKGSTFDLSEAKIVILTSIPIRGYITNA